MELAETIENLIADAAGRPLTHQLQWAITFMPEGVTCKEFVAIAEELGFGVNTAKIQYYKTMKENRDIEALCAA